MQQQVICGICHGFATASEQCHLVTPLNISFLFLIVLHSLWQQKHVWRHQQVAVVASRGGDLCRGKQKTVVG